MTPQLCSTFCSDNSHGISGVEYGRECYCSSSVAVLASTPFNATGCTMPCAGSSSQTCGGRSRLNVYLDPVVPLPSTRAAIGEYVYLGCYTDPSAGQRVLARYSVASAAGMSQGFCVGVCRDKGWAFAGVEYGRECYCGDKLNLVADGGKGELAKSEAECDMVCSGERAELCGGASRIGVWGVAAQN
ncbi:hypothetical protein LTR84_006020 [Exophiala bonariae]|uniref:WSC domain-containing protein n=1 Tax=Exophiala bonariae TaxID=1690606 RepID=A0AAV9N2Z0_9EURO|nr:hypothetical protein LTR84_006020 [Exophiala bonariae]